MKNRFNRSCVVLILILSLCLSLSGCSQQTYWRAIKLYNDGQYDAAATMFSELGDYKDSGKMQTLSRYWEALTLMENGEFSTALPRFLKLGNYEDSADRAIECTYQMALAAFESEDYQTAENFFLEQPQYRNTPEYLRQITWKKLYDAVTTTGSATEDGIALQAEKENKSVRITAADDNRLYLQISIVQNADFRLYDDLTLVLTRENLDADFTATGSFGMDYLEGEIGSVQTASGKVNISTCNIGTQLSIAAFQMTVTDNLGNTTTSTDPADCLMQDTMSANLSSLLVEIPLLLQQSGIDLTLSDIGFPPLA